MTTEIWSTITEHEGAYQASNLGRIRRTATKRIIKVKAGRQGYVRITLHHKGERYKWAVHRLVALTFLGRPINYQLLEVHHKNHKRNDNRADNLEWVTPEYNKDNKMLDTIKAMVYQDTTPDVILTQLKSLFEPVHA